MQETLYLAHGTRTVPFGFRRSPVVWRVEDPVPAIDAAGFRSRLENFVTRTRLDVTRPAVVLADKTRLCQYPDYLPVLLDTLIAFGADPARLTIYVAYGTHARQSETESRAAYGPVYDRFRWVHHRCDDPDAFVELGRTAAGTPVRVRADLTEASAVITFGAISHHYFAGYGGGRKLIFPGLGHKAAIYANHGLFLDQTQRRLSPGCRCGQLGGNPLAEDLAEVEAFFPAHMAVHAILDSHGTVCDLLVGRGVADFRDACARHGRHCEVAGNTCDLVLASCGGYPKDINFIQAHKAIENSAAFVRDGGRLIVLAQCVDGIGSQTFLPWFALGNWGEAFDRLAADYEGNGGTALSMMAKLARIRIGVVTDIAQTECDQIGFERLTLAQARDEIAAFDGPVAVLPNAGMLVRKSGKAPSTP